LIGLWGPRDHSAALSLDHFLQPSILLCCCELLLMSDSLLFRLPRWR
jgi:hypothetical protein